jgi:hypothetical protein
MVSESSVEYAGNTDLVFIAPAFLNTVPTAGHIFKS